MKKVLSILFSIIILCMNIIPSFAAGYAVSVKAPYAATVGETISVSILLSANSGLGGIDLTVKFNTSEYQLVSGSVKSGSLLVGDTNVGSGFVRYAGVSAETVKSNGTLLTFKFKVLKVGGKISVSVNDAIDGNDKDITSLFLVNGATIKCSHADMKWTITKKATCTEKGEKKGTCACDYTKTETIPKSEHSYGKWTVEKNATETEKGLKWVKCTVCGDKKEQVIPIIATTTTETTTETTTFVENTTESTTNEPTTVPTPQIVEKNSTAEIVAKTVAVVLGVEALGLIVFLIGKKKKQK